MNSIISKLSLLVFSSVLLVAIVTASLWSIKQEQQENDACLESILQIQLKVDMLRSQLWVFLQYNDKASLEEVYIAQQSLSKNLSTQKDFSTYIKNLEKMNHSLANLLRKERSLYGSQPRESILIDAAYSSNHDAVSLLHSRYNMLVQSMAEELFHLQREVLNSNQRSHERALLQTAAILLFFSTLVAVMTLLIYKQFKKGSNIIKLGIYQLSKGDFSSRVSKPDLDEEFLSIVNFFNEMKCSLQENIVTKDQLVKEVKSKTSILMQQKDRLEYLSDHDSLTDVLNRRSFCQQLEQSINSQKNTEYKIALLFIDLDKFKQVNDTEGHQIGDLVLVEYASRLKTHIRPTDIVGRVGGDEFIVCLNSLKSTEAITSKLASLMSILEAPMEFDGKTLSVMCSVGVSLYPDQSTEINELLEFADQDMYQAKRQQGCTYYGRDLVNVLTKKMG